MDLLENARLGNKGELNGFLKTYSPFAVANEDCSILLVLRHFKVQYWKDERRVLNCAPEDEHFQWGITVNMRDNDGGCESNIYLPNQNYTGLKIQGNEVEILTDSNKSTKTNTVELLRKLSFWGQFTEKDIEDGFNTLCNEQYEKPKKIEVKNKVINLPSIGKLKYSKKYEWYKSKVNIGNISFTLNISLAAPEELEKLISFADSQLKSKFYEPMLLAMENEMIALKNDLWLGEDEETGKEEPPITVDDFRKRISIDSISFHEDCSSAIYCNDGDIFWGHTIEINIDKDGNYEGVSLAG